MSEQRWESELRGAAIKAEQRLSQVVGYVNDRIVPEVRNEGQAAAREMAAGLRRLADLLEPHRSPAHESHQRHEEHKQTSGQQR